MSYELSVLIPARNEVCYEIDLLAETVTNVLTNSTEATEIIVTLDGYLPENLVQHKRVTYIHHSKSIGQRAATNEAARVSRARYVMKLDAHCAMSKDFDVKLMETFEPHWTVVPAQYNLLAYNWKCKKCGWQKDQSPKPARCKQCGSKFFKQIKHWFPRDGRDGSDVDRGNGKRNTRLTGWRFDTELNYQQWGALSHRYEGQSIYDTMSLLGACWMIERERYYELDICDEKFGSWGDQGTEISCKSWLSGGELKVNTNAWFAHFFRVGGLWFPYEGGGRKERAKARGRELWLKNKWEKQVYPLAWLVEKFRPLPDWHTGDNPALALVNEAAVSFSGVGGITGLASSASLAEVSDREQVSTDAMSLSSLPSARTVPSEHVDLMGSQSQMEGIATAGIIADVIQDQGVPVTGSRQGADKPSPDDSVKSNLGAVEPDTAVPVVVSIADPVPAAVGSKFNSGKDTGDLRKGQVIDDEVLSGHQKVIIPRKTALYYTCLSHDETLELAARNNLKRATNGHEIGAVSLTNRIDFGDWNIVVQREKSGTTMHYQILEGLQRSRADYVFLCESDVLYHPSHFDFTPERDDTFYYNTNVWRIRYQDGHAVRTDNLQQVSGICASRKLLLDHYRKRVELIEQNGGKFDTKRMAYEPGTRGKFGDEKIANWESEYPNIDITGHGQTLTTPHFSIDSFRNPKYAEGWQETDEPLPGWPRLSNGGLQQLLEDLANGKQINIERAG